MINHLINTRSLTAYQTIENELVLDKQHNYLFDLSYLSVLDVQGDKAQEFLQGQLTADLRKISDIQMIQAAQCNLKGRILSLLDIINWQGIKLVVPQDLIEATQISLGKTAQLSRVALQINTNLKVFGFYLQNPQDVVPDSTYLSSELYAQAQQASYCYYHLGDGFYIFVIEADKVADFSQPFIEKNQYKGSLIWHTLQLSKKHFDIYPESRGLFLPHRLGLHETNFISFDKGCYKGQEIIARLHYKSTVKHELKLFAITTSIKLYSGQKVFAVDKGSEIGELVDYSLLGEGNYLVALSMLKESRSEVRFEGSDDSVELSDF